MSDEEEEELEICRSGLGAFGYVFCVMAAPNHR